MNNEPPRALGHPGSPVVAISREEISTLVDEFYGRVWRDPDLGPIFSLRLDADRAAHLARMKQFWGSVLLRSGEYQGRPVPKHKAITEAAPVHFARWLELFRTTSFEVLQPDIAAQVMEKAERIAESLWLAMFGKVGATPPHWLKGPDYLTKYHDSQTGTPTL